MTAAETEKAVTETKLAIEALSIDVWNLLCATVGQLSTDKENFQRKLLIVSAEVGTLLFAAVVKSLSGAAPSAATMDDAMLKIARTMVDYCYPPPQN